MSISRIGSRGRRRPIAKEIILEYLKKVGKPATVREIVAATGLNYNTVRGRLQQLKKEGKVKRKDNGWIAV